MHPVKDELPWYYADKLEWTWQGELRDILKAKPKRKLSRVAHETILKAFKRYGGRFVSNHGEHYFELVETPTTRFNSSIGEAFLELQKNGIFEGEEDYRG